MTQNDKAHAFAGLHVKGKPVVLYNAWDAGSATAIAAAGAKAIATSSWAVAAAQGYRDGEALPLASLERVAAGIAANVDIPVSIDFEGGYSDDDQVLASHVGRMIDTGAIGVNFEDRVVNGPGLYAKDRQADRITAMRRAADRKGVALFINARTDLFLGRGTDPWVDVDEAIDRARIYAAAGASGFFIPGLTDESLIGRIVDAAPLPVNVMIMAGLPPLDRLAALGVARVSHGNNSYLAAMDDVSRAARNAFGPF